jgi:membrane protein YqaA with SNARE-associated domain
MKTALAWIQAFAAAIGGPGLFIIAFLDSSFLSFPQVADLLVISMVVQHPHRMVYYALMATLGSLTGCLAIYHVARRGGEALLRKRFHGPTLTRATGLVQRYGAWTLAVPAVLPPPAPFKLFVLLAGVSGVRPLPFVLAIAGARAVRYLGIGLLTVWYGQQALSFLEAHGRVAAYWVAGGLVALALLVLGWRHVRRRHGVLTSATEADMMP